MTKASAPGKIILFGEHAVVYGRPALAVPVTQVRADVEISDSPRAGVWIEAPDIGLHAELNSLPSDHPLAAVIHNLFFALGLPHPSPSPGPPVRAASPPGRDGLRGCFARRGERGEGLNIRISSTIPVASGLGSGAAVSVALIRALSSHLGRTITDEQVSAIAYEIEKLHHGTPSGIDNTVVTYAEPVYFIKGQPIELFKAGRPFTILIGDTGIRAPTKESVGDVRKLWEADKEKWENVFDEVGEIVKKARKRIENGEWESLGELMNQNHALLQEMSVSSPELDRLVEAARKAEALGAKMSGGGRGGNMIALVKPDSAEAVSAPVLSGAAGTIEASLKEAGAKRVIITQVGE